MTTDYVARVLYTELEHTCRVILKANFDCRVRRSEVELCSGSECLGFQ